jgi:hypothetical protein
VLLESDLALRREARALKLAREPLPGLRLGEQEKAVLRAPPDEHRRDDPGLRREQQRLAGRADL